MTSTGGTDPAQTAVDYDPFADAPISRVAPATEPQREIWLSAGLEPEASLAYNEAISLRLRGTLDRAALERALQGVVDRHEALRGTLGADGTDFCISARLPLTCPFTDLGELEGAARTCAVDAALHRVVITPFDLQAGPLVRAELLRLGTDDHLLVLTAHHIVCDGWSFGVIAGDLAALYGNTALADADSFADFAIAQAQHAASADHRADEAYWVAKFASTVPPLELPVDRPRPRLRTFASRREDLFLEPALVAALKSTGAKQRASLYATLLAAFGVLLQRIAGQDDVVIGIPAAGQAGGGHHSLVGHCVNVLPLRVAIDGSAPFSGLLDQTRRDLLDAFDHQQYTFGTLLQRLAIPRDPGRLPLVSVLFNLDQALDESTLTFPGLRFALEGVPRAFENFELFINAVQVDGGLRLECQFNSDLFDAASVRTWLDAYRTLLQAIAADPQTLTARLPIASSSTLQALRSLQPVARPFARAANLADLVFAQAALAPARFAIRSGGERWTYAELAARAHLIAQAIRARGVATGALVGVCLDRSIDMVATLLGVLEAGAAYVPLDPSYPRDRLQFMAEDAQLALVVGDSSLTCVLDWPRERSLLLDADPLGAPSTDVSPSAGGGESPAYVIYTSGSTGKPKGVSVPHRAVVNFLASMQREPGLGADDRLVAITTLSFDIAVLELYLPLITGAEIVLASRAHATDGGALADLIESSDATVMQATPATWRVLLETGWNGRAGFKALCGGEALPADLAAPLERCCGSLWNMYGPTETTVWSTCDRVVDSAHGITIGRPIDNTQIWIIDAERQPCPIGVPGEIAIGGDGVTLGYLGRPELTADRFIADPFATEPGALLYRTGDRGRWRNDGRLEHQGRLDFQVKLRGYRIELGEIETVLAQQPAIARAIVTTREDKAGDVRLVAHVVARAGEVIDENTVRQAMRLQVPAYMIPQHIVVVPAIPLLPNGKVDRKALSTIGPATGARNSATVAPRNDVERRVAAVMEATLALPGIGIDEDFFALGGHSLLAAQLTARLNRELDAHLSMRAIFDAPTIAGLAAAVEAGALRSDRVRTPVIAVRADQQSAPLSLLQRRLWLFEQLNPGSLVYLTPSAHRLHGPLDERAFQRAFDALVQRQASLRTSIEHDGEEVVQRVHPANSVPLFPAEDLRGWPEAEREAELMRRLDGLTNQPLELTRAPLFRHALFRLADDEHVLFFMPHHIVWDGWSFDLFYEEFAELYAAEREARTPTLAALPVSYGDFSAWHEEWMNGADYAEQFRSQVALWRERFATRGAPEQLPTDRPRTGAMASAGDTRWLAIGQEQTSALREVGRKTDATLFVVMLSVYYAMLHRLVGSGHLVVGTPVRVRASTDVEKVMGLFTNLLPLPVQVSASMRFGDLVRQVKSVVLDSFASPDVQLEDIMREPGMREAAGATHFYQAQFSYQDARQRSQDWGGLHQSQVPLFQRGASEDLALWFLEHAGGMTGGLLYNADLFAGATADTLAARYLELLDRTIEEPDTSLLELTRITRDELARLVAWNSGDQQPTSRDLCLLFETQVDRNGERVALSDGRVDMGYAELDAHATRIAACLRTRAATTGSVVALCFDGSADGVASLLAVLKIGATCVLLDPQAPAEVLRDIAVDASVAILVSNACIVSALGWPAERALCLDTSSAEIAREPALRTSIADAGSAAPAIVLYPHHAGRPARGIGFSTGSLVHDVVALQRMLDLGTEGRRIVGTSTCADACAVLETLLAVCSGATLQRLPDSQGADPQSLTRWIESNHPDVVIGSPMTWLALIDAGWSGNRETLRAVCIDAHPADDLMDGLARRCRVALHVCGSTHGGIAAIIERVDSDPSQDASTPTVTCAAWVLDEHRQPCPIGVRGDLWFGGPGAAADFGARARATPTEQMPDELSGTPDAQLVRSDLRGRWTATRRLALDRVAHRQLRIHGHEVDPVVIETRLLAMPDVMRAAAVVQHAGDGRPILLAFVQPRPGVALDDASLRATLIADLPHRLHPNDVIVREHLPVLPDGRVDHDALSASAVDPIARTPLSERTPTTDGERLLAALWQDILDVPHAGLDDNFFDLGGHSLAAMLMVARVEKRTRVRLNILKVANSSLRALACELPATIGPADEPRTGLGQRVRSLFGFGKSTEPDA